jgi:flagellar protein FlbD
MIRLTRYDSTVFVVNCDIIQYVESTPDTILTLTTGDKLMVRETADEVIARVIEFKREILKHPPVLQNDSTTDIIE